MNLKLSLLLVACLSLLGCENAAQITPSVWETSGGVTVLKGGVNYLSDLEMSSSLNGWGPVELDQSNGGTEANDGRTLTIGGKSYAKGLGMHPDDGDITWAEVQYSLAGQCSSFSAEVGLDDEIDVVATDSVAGLGSVFFQVFADDDLLWQSRRLTGADEALATGTLDLGAAQRLKLVVTNAGDSNEYDHADWGDAKLICASEAAPVPISVSYQADPADFPNPERGFHDNVDILNDSNFDYVKDNGYTLARAYIRLDDYLSKPLDEAFLAKLRRGLAAARTAGLKIIPRFAYNFPGEDYLNAPEAPIDLALQHIEQLGPVYRDYADVIATHPAGFVGAWGEWHSGGNNLGSPENKAKILAALLDAIPENITVQLRYPGDILDSYPTVLAESEAFSNSDQARVGHHNDCFLSNESDAGTYAPAERADAFKRYLDQLTAFTPVGGETCQVTPALQRTDCETAVAELARFRWDYLNIDFYSAAIDRFKAEGCFEDISKRLGYRYRLNQTQASASELDKGETLRLELSLTNDGFGKLYNPRPTQLIFVQRGGDAKHIVTLDQDSRKLLPAPGESKTLSVNAPLPTDLNSGTYDLYLNLPDASSTLSERPEYSIRLANQDVWQPQTGYNALNLTVDIR